VADVVVEMATDGAVVLGQIFFDCVPIVQRGGRDGGGGGGDGGGGGSAAIRG
jgi:hypothetical protein